MDLQFWCFKSLNKSWYLTAETLSYSNFAHLVKETSLKSLVIFNSDLIFTSPVASDVAHECHSSSEGDRMKPAMERGPRSKPFSGTALDPHHFPFADDNGDDAGDSRETQILLLNRYRCRVCDFWTDVLISCLYFWFERAIPFDHVSERTVAKLRTRRHSCFDC